jgi:2-dehydro-3-deoxyphosphooctonate aldolase (KDO 8-P synthase)
MRVEAVVKHKDVDKEVLIGKTRPLAFIAGPCLAESKDQCLTIANFLKELADRKNYPFIFKASYDKANRSAASSFRGIGVEEGLEILEDVKDEVGVLTTTDVHLPGDVSWAARSVDLLQIPAFLCRQNDLLEKAARSGKPVNIKKGQFLSPTAAFNIAEKFSSYGCDNFMLTERGTTFGYGDLIVDMRSLPIMSVTGYCPVVFDATHSVQKPAGAEGQSGGDSKMAPVLARAAVATGYVDAVFMEVYMDGTHPKSDADNSIPLSKVESLWGDLVMIHDISKKSLYREESGKESKL